jgi:hypothetical protein
MKKEFLKKIEGGKRVYRMMDGVNRPGREVDTAEWEIDEYVNYCIYPLQNCISRMHGIDEPDSEIQEFVDMLDRLYDSAHAQISKMAEAIYKDMGWVKIITTNENCRGGFLEQDFLEVFVEKEEKAKVDLHANA